MSRWKSSTVARAARDVRNTIVGIFGRQRKLFVNDSVWKRSDGQTADEPRAESNIYPAARAFGGLTHLSGTTLVKVAVVKRRAGLHVALDGKSFHHSKEKDGEIIRKREIR